jgi:hypothetical protein
MINRIITLWLMLAIVPVWAGSTALTIAGGAGLYGGLSTSEPTTQYTVDALNPYAMRNGSPGFPYITIADAITNAVADGRNDGNPAFIGIAGKMSETVNVIHGGEFFTGLNSSGTHSPMVLTGSWTFAGADGNITNNHFAIQQLEIVGASSVSAIHFTGTQAQRLFITDVWVTANGAGGSGLLADNSDSTSVIDIDNFKISHTATTGDNYCIDATSGTINLSDLETSGPNVQVAIVRNGAHLNITGESEIDAAGAEAIHVQSGGILTIANSQVTNTQNNSSGLMIDSGGVAVLGNVNFSVPMGNGSLTFGATSGTTTIVGVGTTFVSSDVGRIMTLDSGKHAVIATFTDATHVTATITGTLSTTAFATGVWAIGYAIDAAAGASVVYYAPGSLSFLPGTNSLISPNLVQNVNLIPMTIK